MSPVQTFAAEYLIVLEEVDESDRRFHEIKVARFTQDPSLAPTLFPDLFSNEGVEGVALDEDEDIGTTTKGIRFEADMERDEVLETLRQFSQGSVQGADIPIEDDGGGWM